MIYLEKPKIIFIKPRKVAGTSFEIALSKFAGENDIITPISSADEAARNRLGFRGAQNFKYSIKECLDLSKIDLFKALYQRSRPEKFFNHMSAADVKSYLGDKIWTSSKKRTTVRNPYDRIVSQYFYDQKSGGVEFDDWIRDNLGLLAVNNEQYLVDGKEALDFYIRYECLEEDIKNLERQVPHLKGLYHEFSGINAKGGIRPKRATAEEFLTKYPSVKPVMDFFCQFEVEKCGYIPGEQDK